MVFLRRCALYKFTYLLTYLFTFFYLSRIIFSPALESVPLTFKSSVLAQRGLSVPGVSCNFVARQSREMSDAHYRPHFCRPFCRPFMIAARGGPPLLPLPIATPLIICP